MIAGRRKTGSVICPTAGWRTNRDRPSHHIYWPVPQNFKPTIRSYLLASPIKFDLDVWQWPASRRETFRTKVITFQCLIRAQKDQQDYCQARQHQEPANQDQHTKTNQTKTTNTSLTAHRNSSDQQQEQAHPNQGVAYHHSTTRSHLVY